MKWVWQNYDLLNYTNIKISSRSKPIIYEEFSNLKRIEKSSIKPIIAEINYNSSIHEVHVTSGPRQQGVGNKISLKTNEGWESNFLPGTDNTL